MPPVPWRLIRCAGFALATVVGLPSVPADAGDAETLALGREVFLERAAPQCAICHTLADAGATGAVGPNLDDLMPVEQQVRAAVTGGVGAMPPFEDLLSAEEIDAVARYVARVAGQAN